VFRNVAIGHRLEMCMGMGFPMGTGIPWESNGNGNKTQNWEWEWEGMGNHFSGNGTYLHSHGNLFPKVLCCDELIKLLVLYLPDGTDDWCGSGNSGRKWRVIGGGGDGGRYMPALDTVYHVLFINFLGSPVLRQFRQK